MNVLCHGFVAPNDGLVPVESVFVVSAGTEDGAHTTALKGFAVALGHNELTHTRWLTRYVMNRVGGSIAPCPSPGYAPSAAVACGADWSATNYCLEGRGLASDGSCNVMRRSRQDGVALSWTTESGRIVLHGSLGIVMPCVSSSAASTRAIIPNSSDPGIRGFYVHRSDVPNFQPNSDTKIGFVRLGIDAFVDKPLSGQTSFYVVIMARSDGTENQSNFVSITTPPAKRRSVRH
jgi:hypothetical protein